MQKKYLQESYLLMQILHRFRVKKKKQEKNDMAKIRAMHLRDSHRAWNWPCFCSVVLIY